MSEIAARQGVGGESVFDDFPCLELVDPDRDTLERIADQFGIHDLAIEDAVHAHQRPKLERYGDTLLLVVKSTTYDDEQERVDVGENLLLFDEEFLVVVRHQPASDPISRADGAPISKTVQVRWWSFIVCSIRSSTDTHQCSKASRRMSMKSRRRCSLRRTSTPLSGSID